MVVTIRRREKKNGYYDNEIFTSLVNRPVKWKHHIKSHAIVFKPIGRYKSNVNAQFGNRFGPISFLNMKTKTFHTHTQTHQIVLFELELFACKLIFLKIDYISDSNLVFCMFFCGSIKLRGIICLQSYSSTFTDASWTMLWKDDKKLPEKKNSNF